MHPKCLVLQVSPPQAGHSFSTPLKCRRWPFAALSIEWIYGKHYVWSADRSVWRTTLSVLACQQRTGDWLTNRTTINPRNFGNRSLSYGITR